MEDHNMPAIEDFVSDALATIDISPHLRYLLNRKLIRRSTNDFLWASVVISDILANIDTLNEKQLLGLIDGLPVSQKISMKEHLVLRKVCRVLIPCCY